MNYVLGVVVALVAGLLGEQALVRWQHQAQSQTTYTVAAGEAQAIEQAAQLYVNTYQATLETAATSTTPAVVTVPMLISTGFLPTGTQSLTPYGQTWQVEVLQPTAGTLQAMLVTTGGSPMKDSDAVQVVQKIGSTGGFYPQNTGNVYPANAIIGAGGGWTITPVTPWPVSKGYLASYINLNGDSSSYSYLYRNAVPGNTALNTMNTPLIMAATETVGDACASQGAIAQDGTGALVSCQSAVWTGVGDGHWQAPVATYASLPTTGNTIGDVRLTLDTDRAFAWSSGSTWAPLSVDQNGNMDVPSTLTVGGNANVAGTVTAPTVNASTTLLAANNQFQVSGTSGYGILPEFASGWAMLTAPGGNGSYAAKAVSTGSVDSNDYYNRATGWWFSTAVSDIQTLQSQVAALQTTTATQTNQITTIGGEITSDTNTCSFAGNGYCVDNGELIEWGSFYTDGSGSNIAENFPKKFTTAAYSLTTTQPSATSYGYPIQACIVSTSQFTWNCGSSPSASQAATIYWIAVGH